MRIHHLNCVSTCPLGGKLMDGRTSSLVRRGRLTCHCLLVDTGSMLVLLDTGLGLHDVREPHARLSGFFLRLVSPDFREEMTARRQVEGLGYNADDVRHIVLTHLDFDHAGGLDDFPGASVHMLQDERDAAVARKTWLDKQRFRPEQWSTRANWITYGATAGDDWFGFDCVRALVGVPPEILLMPLVGHTFGHAGIAVNRGDGWLLYAGDAYFFHEEMNVERPRCTPGLRAYQRMMEKNRTSRLGNQERLRELRRTHGNAVEIFCGHDTVEFERLAGTPADLPLGSGGLDKVGGSGHQ
jgi:glyoxylase-like metal-dependent hydrolase (beta-lactamase superfamily II)